MKKILLGIVAAILVLVIIMARATPDTIRTVHGIDERIPVEDYLTAIRFYYAVIRQATE